MKCAVCGGDHSSIDSAGNICQTGDMGGGILSLPQQDDAKQTKSKRPATPEDAQLHNAIAKSR